MVVFGSYEDWRKEDLRVFDLSKSVLSPSQDLIEKWAFYQGKCSEEVRENYFTRRYFDEVLKNLNPFMVLNLLENKIILEEKSLPVRFILGAWLNLCLDNESDINFEYAFMGDEDRTNIRVFLEGLINTKEKNKHVEKKYIEKATDEVWFEEQGRRLYFVAKPFKKKGELIGQVKMY